ncbi:NIN-like protein [Artemisia annua]|uniref:NIN-like protein n=1 Tax=Artemisia annua TaxID=35608 RepID=A0A2U1MME4_ARTAN|nr:NIN-like protein [Artemisia annua]
MADDNDNVHRLGVVQEKMKTALSNVCWSYLNGGLIQFWAPVNISGRRLLSTFDQPFVTEHIDSVLTYRICCMRYNYNVDFYYNNIKVPNLPGGMPFTPKNIKVPTTAFRNHLPEVIVNLKSSISNSRRRRMSGHEVECLSVCSAALECELTSSLLLPVFCQESCVGVVEYSTRMRMKGSHLVLSFNELQRVLVSVGLNTFHAQECWPYKAVPALKVATYEIEEALEIVCESHYLTLAQVWMCTHVNENFIPFPSMDGPQFAIKFIGYSVKWEDDDVLSSIKGILMKCVVIMSFWRYSLLPVASSCLTICLRSTHTREDVDYVFEFLWPAGRDYHILVESILLTLMRCLPHFMFPCGAKVGDDELCVVNVDNNSRESRFRCFHNYHKSSPLLKKTLGARKRFVAEDESISSLEVKSNPLHREDVKQEVGSTIQETSTNYYGRKFVRRKLSDMCQSQQCESTEEASSSSSSYSDTYPNKDMLTVKAEYEDDLIAFLIPTSSATLAALKKEIHEGFELNNVGYELAYMDNASDLISIRSDEEVRVSIWDRPANTTHIKLYVLPLIY